MATYKTIRRETTGDLIPCHIDSDGTNAVVFTHGKSWVSLDRDDVECMALALGIIDKPSGDE